MKLISMVDFVLNQKNTSDSMGNSYWKCKNYANFLSQKLSLDQFIPCKLVDGVWVILENTYSKQPDRNDYFNDLGGNPELYQHNMRLWREYQEAKDRVLFEGFCYSINGTVLSKNKLLRITFIQQSIIEDLVKYNLKLTSTAQKQIEL